MRGFFFLFFFVKVPVFARLGLDVDDAGEDEEGEASASAVVDGSVEEDGFETLLVGSTMPLEGFSVETESTDDGGKLRLMSPSALGVSLSTGGGGGLALSSGTASFVVAVCFPFALTTFGVFFAGAVLDAVDGGAADRDFGGELAIKLFLLGWKGSISSV